MIPKVTGPLCGNCVCFLSVGIYKSACTPSALPILPGLVPKNRELRFIEDRESAKNHTRCFTGISPFNPGITLEVATVSSFSKKIRCKVSPKFKKNDQGLLSGKRWTRMHSEVT